ncbi:Inosine-uridine nucleoside N-ribohydrolase [Geosmithia morbida]|uniref:Inosine-uridine nucleoside N-ribohydrolase n=1 Tax=Geosmithia morbida TaxID=1094350 RepID=A0A9P4YZ34_9HYPO|nr:Inosine-uridine nucleoside N-ribohydrolase [Geosmithia morbida]KAF4125721.1 Inosine-uridine nucleoside N-ribohydrolase [Geosmithia morbida]
MHWQRELLLLTTSIVTVFGAAATAGAPKIIIDNDWGATAYITFLLAIDAGWDVLGLVGDTANTWSRQASLHALALLEAGNLSCIPVHKGADLPLLNTAETFQLWEDLQGPLPWHGVFARENATAEAAGSDPTSGDPSRVVREAFVEGYPNNTLAGEHAAAWMVEQVRKYPGEVLIYSGGALTNVALAARLDPEFASLTKGLVVMGGYVDVWLLHTSGSLLLADINSDLNLKIDPEAAQIALTSKFPNITLVGNGANQVFPERDFIDNLYNDHKNVYTELFYKYYDVTLPYWDELTIFASLYPEHVTNQTSFLVSVDTAWSSPFYGNIMVYQELFAPKAQKLRYVDYVYQINQTAFLSSLESALKCPRCATLCK